MGREENQKTFRDTEQHCRKHSVLKSSIAASVEAQKLIAEADSLPAIKTDLYDTPAKVVVSKKRTYEAAQSYKGNRVAVHNFASASNPGGGVVKGANAQEECLCRCSTLYFCLDTHDMWEGFYKPHRNEHNPLHNDDIIYTPDVTVFKTDTAYPELMREEDWYSVNVITCAAPNLRPIPSNQHNSGDGMVAVKIKDSELLKIHQQRLTKILDVAVSEGNDTVILGAFGCGAFMNSPDVVAEAARRVLPKYLYAFRNIEFAVYCHPKDDSNFRAFDRVLKAFTK